MPKTPKDEKMVRINVILPPAERIAFDKWCRYGTDKPVSMNRRIRQLLKADVAGRLPVSRDAEPVTKEK